MFSENMIELIEKELCFLLEFNSNRSGNMKKRILPIALALMLCFSLATPAMAKFSPTPTAAADRLNALGLFNGVGYNADGTPNYDLDRKLNRMEAITLIVRLVGGEEKALSQTWTMPFSDVDDWAKSYVGYAYANGLTNGVSATKFGGRDDVSELQFLTLVLRALGYSSDTDFQWDNSRDLASTLGITHVEIAAGYGPFFRRHATMVCAAALDVKLKNSDRTLLRAIGDNLAMSAGDSSMFSLGAIKLLLLDYYNEQNPDDGRFVIFDGESVSNGGTYTAVVRYQMTAEEYQPYLDQGLLPLANVLAAYVTVDRSTGSASIGGQYTLEIGSGGGYVSA